MEGKQITARPPEQERQHQQRENLITGIAKLWRLSRQFSKVEEGNASDSNAPEFYTFAELFARDSEGQHPETFAKRKAEHLEQALKEVRETTTPDYYEGHPVYKYAAQYIGYLQGIGRKPEPTSPTTQSPDFIAYFADRSKYNKVVNMLKLHHIQGKTAEAARIILAAQELGYITKNIKAAPLHRALQKVLQGIGSERAFREALRTGTAKTYKEELQQA
ncbi:MAG: hypothetical protein IJ553_05290 [Alloprevotella sp.]|nr:hypothetical protein [Alloprevotella sp.]